MQSQTIAEGSAIIRFSCQLTHSREHAVRRRETEAERVLACSNGRAGCGCRWRTTWRPAWRTYTRRRPPSYTAISVPSRVDIGEGGKRWEVLVQYGLAIANTAADRLYIHTALNPCSLHHSMCVDPPHFAFTTRGCKHVEIDERWRAKITGFGAPRWHPTANRMNEPPD